MNLAPIEWFVLLSKKAYTPPPSSSFYQLENDTSTYLLEDNSGSYQLES